MLPMVHVSMISSMPHIKLLMHFICRTLCIKTWLGVWVLRIPCTLSHSDNVLTAQNENKHNKSAVLLLCMLITIALTSNDEQIICNLGWDFGFFKKGPCVTLGEEITEPAYTLNAHDANRQRQTISIWKVFLFHSLGVSYFPLSIAKVCVN